MNKNLDELESDISELRTRLYYVEISFENMESKLDDIQWVINDEVLNEEEKFRRIDDILARL